MTRAYLRSDLRDRGIKWSNRWLIELESQNKFPKRFYLSTRTVGWDADAIDAWLEAKRAGSGAPEPKAA